MARQIKVELDSGRKGARSGLAGEVLSHILAYSGPGARFFTLMVMHSVGSSTTHESLQVKAEPMNIFPEDALFKRMQMLR
jgi:hypothetical protein